MSSLTPGTFDIVTGMLTFSDGERVKVESGTITISTHPAEWHAAVEAGPQHGRVPAEGNCHVHLTGNVFVWETETARFRLIAPRRFEITGDEPLAEHPAAAG